jgi:hypothetical protein
MGGKGDWSAIKTVPGQEFIAHSEIRRFRFTAYLPQRKQRIFPEGAKDPVFWAVPLIRGHVLMLLSQARDRALRYAQGVRRDRYLVESNSAIWTVSDGAIRELSGYENQGAFDDPSLCGNMARLAGAELIAAIAGEALANLFAPLFPAPGAPVPREPTKDELERELLEAGRSNPGLRASAWTDSAKIRASTAPDVLARAENYSLDDRTFEQRSADASRARAASAAARRARWAAVEA